MKNKKNNIITYKERASFYDIEYDDQSDKAMLKYFIGQAKSVLEIPCGSGRNIDLYHDTDAKITLIDIEKEMISFVKKKIVNCKNITCMVGDLLNLKIILIVIVVNVLISLLLIFKILQTHMILWIY